MIIINIGEYANKLSNDIRRDNPNIPWKDVIGMRNIFAHNYIGVNFKTLWDTLNEDIPYLKEHFQLLLE